MPSVYLLLIVFGIVHVGAEIRVKTVLYVELSAKVNDTALVEGLSNVVNQLKNVACQLGGDCQDKKEIKGSTTESPWKARTYYPYRYSTSKPWNTAPYYPYRYNSSRPWYTSYYPYRYSTSRPWNTSPFYPYRYNTSRPWNTSYYPYRYTTSRPWNTSPYYRYRYTTSRPWNTSYYPHRHTTRGPWTTRRYPFDYSTGRPWNETTYIPYYPPNNYTNERHNTTDIPHTYDDDARNFHYYEGEESDLLDCSDLPAYSGSGLYNISADGGVVEVYCDMVDDGGKWTFIQRHRVRSPLKMNKTWDEYKNGFGKIMEVFWLGNKQISDMTNRRNYSLRVEIVDDSYNRYSATYDLFRLGSEDKNFTLYVSDKYFGDAGDGLSYHNTMPFSTIDHSSSFNNNDCGRRYGGGWWYVSCNDVYVDLNGFKPVWLMHSRLTYTQMKIRPT